MISIDITHSIDEDGTPTVMVPLQNISKSCTLFEEDLQLLFFMGVTPVWRIFGNSIIAKGKVAIARLLLDAKANERVRYKDGDPCNLKRDNLVSVSGAGKFNAREQLLDKPVTFRERVKINHKHKLPSWEISEQLTANA